MKKAYSEIVYNALRQTDPKLPEDSKKLVTALMGLSGDYPKELDVVLRSVDEKFLEICCSSIDQNEADVAQTVEKASDHLKSEYMMNDNWAKYISEQFVTAIRAYEKDRPIKGVGAPDSDGAVTEPIGADLAAGAVTEPIGADLAAGAAAVGIIEPEYAGRGAGMIEPEYAGQGSGGRNTEGKKRLVFIAGVGAMAILIALGSYFAVSRIIGNDGGSSDDKVAVETTKATEPTEESSEGEGTSRQNAEPAPVDRVFAHRGTGGSENSFASFDSAISQGAKYLEQDVVLLDDGEFYVSHDRALTLDTARNQGNPRLRDVFDKYGKKVVYVVELKTWTSSAAHSLVSLIDEYGYEGNVIVQCFEQELLGVIKSDQPGITTMCLCDYNGRDGQGLVSSGCTSDYIDMICVDSNGGLMTSDNLQLAHNSDKKFGAWCLDSEAQIRQAIDMGLDFYFTRSPEMAIELEKEYR